MYVSTINENFFPYFKYVPTILEGTMEFLLPIPKKKKRNFNERDSKIILYEVFVQML